MHGRLHNVRDGEQELTNVNIQNHVAAYHANSPSDKRRTLKRDRGALNCLHNSSGYLSRTHLSCIRKHRFDD
jgi:hypothetical protein